MCGNAMKILCLSVLTTLLLNGCASHVHQMVKENDSPFITGELAHEDGKGNRLVLMASNRRYEAHGFVVERQTNLAALRKRYYGVNPKHWDRILSNLDTDHVTYSIDTIAKSVEGDKVSCHLGWGSGAKPAGVCTDQAGETFPVRFE